MKKTYYIGAIAAIAIVALPAFLNAQTMMDVGGAAGVGASMDGGSVSATVNAGNNIRQQIRDDYQNRLNNIENNRDARNILLGSSTRPFARPPILGGGENERRNASSTEYQKYFVASSTIQNMHLEMERMRENRVQELKMQKNRMVKQLGQVIANLQQIRGRIETRITEAEQNGKDMTGPNNLLVIAGSKISTAQLAVVALDNFNASSTITTAATTTVDLTKPRQLLNSAEQAIKVARDALNAVVVSLAHNLGVKIGGDNDRNSTPTATGTTTITSTSTIQ